MSSETGSETPPCDFDENTVYCGRCKWFNNKAGYGFVTVVRSDNDAKMGTDVFAHHSGITVGSEQYKYLVQGEYVDFKMHATEGGEHTVQASGITGVGGGWLMCETRHKARQAAEQDRGEDGEGEERRPSRRSGHQGDRRHRGNVPRQDGGQRQDGAQVRLRGEGPRGDEVWTLTRSTVSKSNRKHPRKEEEKS